MMAADPPESPRMFTRLDDFTAYARPMPIIYWFYLSGSLLAALVVLVCGLILAVIIRELPASFPKFISDFVALFELGIFVGIFMKLLRRAKRYRLDSQAEILEDPRPPVLLLRSFRSDVVADKTRRDQKTAEEFLVEVFSHVGPVVAVGKPGEALSVLGAARLYFNDEEWRKRVESLISISQLVIIQAGTSDALEWELSRAVSMLKPHQLLVSFAHFKNRQTSYEQFLYKAARVLDAPFPQLIGDTFFWTFKEDWTPVELSPQGRGDFKKKIKSAVEPVIRRDSRRQNIIKQVLGMIFSPRRTFQDIGWKENWLAPLVFSSVILLLTFYFQFYPALTQSVDTSWPIIRNMFTALIFMPVTYLVLSGVIWLALMLCRINITIKQVICIFAWSSVPVQTVHSVVLFIRSITQRLEPTDSLDWTAPFSNLSLNLAALLPADVSPPFKALASTMDLFSIWRVFLLSLGFIVIAGGTIPAKRRRIALIIASLLLLYLVMVATA